MELLLMWSSVTFAADCPDPAAEVAAAEKLVLFADLEGARAALSRAEVALACSPPVDRALLGQMWLVEGARLADAGDVAGAATSFAAARRVAPTVWIDGLGPEKRATYEAIVPVAGLGQIVIDAPAGGLGTVWVDGVGLDAPISVVPGEHLVQYGSEGRAWFARIVLVSADQASHVRVTAAPASRRPVAGVEPVVSEPAAPRAARTGAYAHLAVGVDVAFGGSLADAVNLRPTDPPAAFLVPIELGGGVLGKYGWARAAVSVAPVFSGSLLVMSAEGAASTSAFAVGGHVATGLSVGPMDFGLLGGYVWPGRYPLRLVIGVTIPEAPVEIELRVGANVLRQHPFEPAVSLLFAFPGTGASRPGRKPAR